MADAELLRTGWVLASRDDERAAWAALYEAAHPRPTTPTDTGDEEQDGEDHGA